MHRKAADHKALRRAGLHSGWQQQAVQRRRLAHAPRVSTQQAEAFAPGLDTNLPLRPLTFRRGLTSGMQTRPGAPPFGSVATIVSDVMATALGVNVALAFFSAATHAGDRDAPGWKWKGGNACDLLRTERAHVGCPPKVWAAATWRAGQMRQRRLH